MSSLHPAVTAVTAAHLADTPSASGVAAAPDCGLGQGRLRPGGPGWVTGNNENLF